jgi:hypothetical protein
MENQETIKKIVKILKTIGAKRYFTYHKAKRLSLAPECLSLASECRPKRREA